MRKIRNLNLRSRRLIKLLRVMKLLTVFLIVGTISVTANTLAQDSKVTLKLNKVNLEEVLWKIHEQTGVVFLYSTNDVEDVTGLQIEAVDEDVKEVLKKCLEETGLEYEFKNDAVILRKAEIKTDAQQAQERIIKGFVYDDQGLPLPGVSVIIKGTTTGTATGFDGEYSLKIPADKKVTLVFSFIGMNNQEVFVTDQKELKVTLESNAEQIEEIVVTTGYQRIDRRLFTGAAAKVNAEEAKVDGIADVGRMLEGKAAGVSVQNVSGTFGAAPKIRVRGSSSIYGDQKPLWVVDGVVLEDIVDVSPDDLSSGDAATLISSAVAGLNANDIENFQILKDASATALYGARAMNGVIVITTKKGKAGSTRVNYSGEFTMRMKPTYNDFNIMNSKDQMSVYRELERKGWLNQADITRKQNGGIYKKMYDLINTYNLESGQFGLANTPEARAKYLQQYEMANTDWFDVLFRNTIIQNHAVSISGGTDKAKFYFSTSVYNDKGWTLADKVNRYTTNMKANVDLTERLSIGLSSMGSFRQQKAPGTMKRVTNKVEGTYDRNFDVNPFSYALNTSRALRPYDENGDLEYFRMNYAPFNIINELDNNYIDLDVLDLNLQANLNYKLAKGLDFNFVGSIRYVKSTQEHKIRENSNMAMAYRAADDSQVAKWNNFLYRDIDNPDALPEVVLPRGGFYNRTDNRLLNYYLRNTINWNHTFNDTHIVNCMGGQELKYADRQDSSFDGVGYQWDRGGVPFIDYRFLKQQIQGGYNYYGMGEFYDRFLAYFGTASYSYMGKYTVNGTYRYDGSNRLGKARSARWLPTWNVSGSWNAHGEEFLKNSNVISHLTLRATYGLTASMGAANNSTLVLMNMVADRPYTSEKESQMYIRSLENSELTWEKQYETNVGIDLGLFKNRISLSLDAYQRDGFDLIGYVRTSGIGGEYWKFANYANMKSHGIEFTLGTKNIVKSDLSWNTNLTFAYNENEITNLKSNPMVYDLVKQSGGALEGYPVRGLFSIPFEGLDKDGIPTFTNDKGEVTSTDVNFQSEDVDFLKYEGSIDPKVTGGLSNVVKYKNWKLNVFVSYQWGNKIRLYPSFKAYYTDLDAMPKEFFDRWSMTGDEAKTNIPTILSKRQYDAEYRKTYSAYNRSTDRIADGSFVRLKEVSLAYSLPKTILEQMKLSSMQFKLQATNLFLLYSDDKLQGQDPEFFGAGGVAMPVPRQFTFTLKFGI
ncbi:SusC/RagA family TonB-linked outer membrane protein [Marinilabiliaceae bacterium JC017]|nr:SusC/RagA family TonB-linked outer membrane protein [Marinilabiliaceae bacterium JC017]